MKACAHPNQTQFVDEQAQRLCNDCGAELPLTVPFAKLDIYLFSLPFPGRVRGHYHYENEYEQLQLPFLTPAERREQPKGVWEE